MDTTASSQSLARPKIGRPPVQVAQENKPFEQKEFPEISRTLGDGAPSTRPWDFKFALLLVTLFVAVNLGLIILLHNGHSAPKNSSGTVVAEKATIKPMLAKPAPIVEKQEVQTPAPVAQAPVSPAPVMATPAVTAAAPVAAPTPAAATSALAAETAAVVSAPAVPVATAATAAVPAVAATQPASAQDLLTIISKN
jgi:hypothetical protein